MNLKERVQYELNNGGLLGITLGLIFAFVYLGIFGGFFCSGKLCGSDSSLALDFKNGNVPYGVLWVILNPFYWTQQPYMIENMVIVGTVLVLQYYLYRCGKLSKWIVLMNLFNIVFFSATHVYQENTKIMLGPLAVVNPLFVIPMIMQILPIGWSFNLQDPHWNCGINGQCISFVNGRLDIVRSDFITHISLAFWCIVPILIWYRNTTGRMPFKGQFEWAERHWKILSICWIGFMLFLTLWAYLHNGGFWTWTEGS